MLDTISNKKNNFIVLLDLNDEQEKRLKDNSVQPKWFGYPILKTNYNVLFTRDIFTIIKFLIKNKTTGVLVFNIDILDVILSLLSLLLPSRVRICVIYQWMPLEKLELLKRIVYTIVLKSSRIILTYSQYSAHYLANKYINKYIRWIGLFTDTEYFKPMRTDAHIAPYFLCPGNHLREEGILFEIANRIEQKIIRFSSDPKVKEVYDKMYKTNIEFKYNLSFTEIRELYNNSIGVLNIANDEYIPAGITTFCEGLSMNKIVITHNGHSCSGYKLDNEAIPFIKINNLYDVEEWLKAIRLITSKSINFDRENSPRKLAEATIAFEICKKNWDEVLNKLFAGK